MKKLAMAMAVAVTPLSAEAQNCLSLEQIHEAYTEQGLNTDMVFQSRVQDGPACILDARARAKIRVSVNSISSSSSNLLFSSVNPAF